MFNYVKSQLGDPAQTHYLVDSDFRTVAQGWARADGTGPLDLWAHRNPGYVYRTGEYSTDIAAWNAARDAMVDYRGDVLFLPPCALSLAASTWDVPYARFMGKEYKSPKFGASPGVYNTQITITGTQTLGADAIGSEVGYVTFIPETGETSFTIAAATHNCYFHDFFWNLDGITTSASTLLFDFATTAVERWVLDQFTWLVDAPQGPVITTAIGLSSFLISNFRNMAVDTSGTYATSLLDINTGAAATEAMFVGPGIGLAGVGGGAGTVTELINSVDLTGTAGGNLVFGFYGSQNYSAATTLVTSTGDDWGIAESYVGATGPTSAALYTS